MADKKRLTKEEKAKIKAAKKNAAPKPPITHTKIFKIMVVITLAVMSVFLLINIIKLNVPGIIAIGACLLAFVGTLMFMKWRYVKDLTKEFVVSIALEVLILVISLFSGASYSDDFPMFLAVIGMTGLYMEPKFTKVQIVLADIFLVLMYIIHPEKAGGLTQYLLCMAVFTLAGILFYLAINRGRAFIEVARVQAAEAERLLLSIRNMGEKLQYDFETSSQRIDDSTKGLKGGSDSIAEVAMQVSERCGDVHDKIYVAEQNIEALNQRVKQFESALAENSENISLMQSELNTANEIIFKANEIFMAMKTHMNEVGAIAEQLGSISFKTTLLSLNASVEASHAGDKGAGFAVVASEMKELSDSSDRFADRVSDVVAQLLMQVEQTEEEFEGSTRAITKTSETMSELQESFARLTEQFDALYANIAEQTESVNQVDSIFGELNGKIAEMNVYSRKNNSSVEEIVNSMDEYRENIGKVIANTKIN